ncbi:MAG: MATE family efflux transporter [Clostridiales bacterium]|nr:MAG: MATE family efflux transporter [Clostridiales bacterium]
MNSDQLGTGKIWPLIIKMTLPAIAAQLVNLLYSIVDRIYIGHIPGIGETALTGVGLATPVVVIISSFSQFVGGGGAPLASIALGQGRRERAEEILGNGTSLLLGLSVLLQTFFYLFMHPFLYFTGASDATYPYASAYLSIYLIGTVMVLISVGLTPFILIQGKTWIATLAVVVGAAANIILDPVFIYLFNMGVHGAALATVISQTMSAAFVLWYLIFKSDQLRIRLRRMRPRAKILLHIGSLGISPFVMSITESIISIVMNSGLRTYGGDLYVGCLTIMQSVMQFIGVPITGFTQGVTPIISYNYGAGHTDRVKKTFRATLVILFAYTSSLALLSMLFPGLCARIFTESAELIALTERALPIFMAGMLIFGLQRACQTTFLALGQAKFSLFIALLRKVFLLVPLALILPRFMGVFGIYWAEPIADVTAALTCGTLFLCNFKKILARPPKS